MLSILQEALNHAKMKLKRHHTDTRLFLKKIKKIIIKKLKIKLKPVKGFLGSLRIDFTKIIEVQQKPKKERNIFYLIKNLKSIKLPVAGGYMLKKYIDAYNIDLKAVQTSNILSIKLDCTSKTIT